MKTNFHPAPRLLALSLALALSATAAPALAACMNVSVFDRDSGRTLPTYQHHGVTYVAGEPGQKYGVRLHNCSRGRELAVVSVDGVNVVSGETAASGQTGYVLTARSAAEITGWRKNLDEVAAFNFSSANASYAAKTGRAGNVGVIGVAVFDEMQVVQHYQESRGPTAWASTAGAGPSARDFSAYGDAPRAESASADQANGSMARMQAQKSAPQLGTGHGEREVDRVSNTEFDRATASPARVITLRYDTKKNLIRAGVIPAPQPQRPSGPSAFPGDSGFVADPPY